MRLFSLLLLGLCGLAANAAQSGDGSAAQQVQLHEQRAHQLLNEKKPELAVKEFAAVLAADPHNLDAQANLGVLLYFQKNYVAAEPHLRDALEQKPDLTKIRALLGMCERRLGKTDAARTDLQAVVDQLQEPNIRLEAGLELIEIYTASQELEKAAAVVAVLRQGAPTDPRILYVAYRIYTDLAGEALLDLSVAAPDSGQMHQAMAHELVRQRDINGAITNYRKAMAVDPNLPGIHFELAEALHSSPDLKQRAEAEQEYKRALVVNGLDAETISRLGDLQADKGDLDGAATYYKQALKLQPGYTDAALGLARFYTEKNDPASALPLLEQVTTADPTNVLAHYRLSAVYRKLNRPADAKRELDAYQKYKDIKEKLRLIYKELRLETSQNDEGK
ncbi:MAG TPA: tetratricopeptide repeat protein [Edaphobacter sp.]|nr:tetratricopeptide repeat protein [Edaphobacter sp.]